MKVFKQNSKVVITKKAYALLKKRRHELTVDESVIRANLNSCDAPEVYGNKIATVVHATGIYDKHVELRSVEGQTYWIIKEALRHARKSDYV